MTKLQPKTKIEKVIAKILNIKNTGRGHDRFGACEVCSKRCDSHYYQSGSPTGGGLFGHVDCLKSGLWLNAKVVHSVD